MSNNLVYLSLVTFRFFISRKFNPQYTIYPESSEILESMFFKWLSLLMKYLSRCLDFFILIRMETRCIGAEAFTLSDIVCSNINKCYLPSNELNEEKDLQVVGVFYLHFIVYLTKEWMLFDKLFGDNCRVQQEKNRRKRICKWRSVNCEQWLSTSLKTSI